MMAYEKVYKLAIIFVVVFICIYLMHIYENHIWIANSYQAMIYQRLACINKPANTKVLILSDVGKVQEIMKKLK